ncbi:GspH/FimT family pseudopilin [Chitinibacter sp. GC72]|uniref:GspH/FimT family pseudopilin n=1 Tax=Chitinibacter sp. GC72 TaxID=1526917 RepID=UPI0012FB98AC|nr:GspH/FimT family pseudopilin [Chitinibacter sp. GC72]
MKQLGLSLVELVVTLAIITIVLTIAATSYGSYIQQSRLKGFAENLSADLRYAQNEARASKNNVCVEITTGSSWTYTLRKVTLTGASSVCSTGGTVLKTKTSSEIKNTSINSVLVNGAAYDSSNPPLLDGIKGTVKLNGAYSNIEITLENSSESTYRLKLLINPLGLITMCSPAAYYIAGYTKC